MAAGILIAVRDGAHGMATVMRKGDIMIRLIDRIIDRVVPKATASACSSINYCAGKNLINRFCCPQTGCTFTVIGRCGP